MPPIVTEHARLDDQDTGEVGLDDFHDPGLAASSSFRKRSSASLQAGRGPPTICSNRVVSSTDQAGRRAGLGNSAVEQGVSNSTLPARRNTWRATSYQVAVPSFVTWTICRDGSSRAVAGRRSMVSSCQVARARSTVYVGRPVWSFTTLVGKPALARSHIVRGKLRPC